MDLSDYLSYRLLPTGNVIVFSKDEAIVMQGTVKEVSDRLDYMIAHFKEFGLTKNDPA